MEDRIVRRTELEAMVSLTERQIRTLETEGKFPKRFVIVEGGRAVGWSLNEVQDWLATRREARESVDKPGMAKAGQRIGAKAA
jgi:predicted DNA-binding transcriptional regulator AlpA